MKYFIVAKTFQEYLRYVELKNLPETCVFYNENLDYAHYWADHNRKKGIKATVIDLQEESQKEAEKVLSSEFSHPTFYRGRLYRSRLEAKWGAFFYNAGIYAEYEGLEFSGCIPDFIIPRTNEGKPLLVEVKPYDNADDFLPVWKSRYSKIVDLKTYNYMFVGLAPYYNETIRQTVIGYPLYTSHQGEQRLHVGCLVNEHGSFHIADFYSNINLMNGFDADNDSCVEHDRVLSIWSTACNDVQWKPNL